MPFSRQLYFSMCVLWIACSGDKPITDTDDPNNSNNTQGEESNTDESTNNGCVDDSNCQDGQICVNATCEDGDRNNSVAEAIFLLWGEPTEGILNPSDDIDYYRFTASGGEYIRISTKTEYVDGDTVIVLRDSDGKIVTWADNYPTNSKVNSLDSVIYAYLSAEGDYYISVEDYNSFFETGNNVGDTEYEYQLELKEWSDYTSEPDTLSDASIVMDIEDTSTWYSIGSVIAENDDIDYVALNFTAPSNRLTISGIVNMDGSDLVPHVELYNEDGELLSYKNNLGPDGSMLYPLMEAGTYHLSITDENGNGGEDYWTYIFLLALEGDSYPIEVEPNNNQNQTLELEMTETTNNNGKEYARAQQSGALSEEGDEDWFKGYNLYPDGNVVVCLTSTHRGSTLSPILELYDSSLTLIESVQSDPDSYPNATIDGSDRANGIVMPEGPFYIRIYAEENEDQPLSLSDWYQFIAYSATFFPTNYDCP